MEVLFPLASLVAKAHPCFQGHSIKQVVVAGQTALITRYPEWVSWRQTNTVRILLVALAKSSIDLLRGWGNARCKSTKQPDSCIVVAN